MLTSVGAILRAPLTCAVDVTVSLHLALIDPWKMAWAGAGRRLVCCGVSEGESLIGDGVTQGIVRIGDTGAGR